MQCTTAVDALAPTKVADTWASDAVGWGMREKVVLPGRLFSAAY